METLMDASRIYLGPEATEPVRVEGIRLHKGSPLLKLAGVDDMDSACSLKGARICLPLEELEPLDEGEYFLHDLVGLTVMDHKGETVGRVDNFVQTPGPPLMALTGPSGKEILIPFASGTVSDVDLEQGSITLVDLPGLVED
jgi:16S rRNA processing protein RimM